MLHVYVRHCKLSQNSLQKGRPAGFSREALFETLLQTLPDTALCTVVLDSDSEHFTERQVRARVVKRVCGSDAKSFQFLLETVRADIDMGVVKLTDTVVFLEDDYIVHKSWVYVIEEALSVASYASGYDHPDKYTAVYANVPCHVYRGSAAHYRTTCSTTNSYAMKAGTLLSDWDIHMNSSRQGPVVNDHGKFLELWAKPSKKETLVTPIPSVWSHEETGMSVALAKD